MYILGNIPIPGLSQPSSFDSSEGAIYAKHPKLGGKSALQRTGDENDTVELIFELHRDFCVPENIIKDFQTAKNAGTVLPLGTSDGDALGDFVITGLMVSRTNSTPGASIISATVTVSLLEHATVNGTAERTFAARSGGFAVDTNNPPTQATPTTTNMVEFDAMASTMATGSSVQAIDSSLANATAYPATEAHQRVVIGRRLDTLISDANNARDTVNAFGGQKYTDTRGMEGNLVTLIAGATSMKAVVATATTTDLKTLASQLRSMVSALKLSAQALAKYTGTRS